MPDEFTPPATNSIAGPYQDHDGPGTLGERGGKVSDPYTPPEKCVSSVDARHCWHVAASQHTVMNHRDDVCCWCGFELCVDTWPADRAAKKGHGEYHP